MKSGVTNLSSYSVFVVQPVAQQTESIPTTPPDVSTLNTTGQPLPPLYLQAGNNLLIVQSPGQPAMVQQVQVVQPKPESQVVQIPQQALKVVQAASATLPTVPQRQSVPSSLQVTQTDPTPTQVSTQKHTSNDFSSSATMRLAFLIFFILLNWLKRQNRVTKKVNVPFLFLC